MVHSASLPNRKTKLDTALNSPAQLPGSANIDFSLALRGIVIVAVLLNHYVDHFMTMDGHDIANTMVSVFFVLSGYGISASLRRKMGEGFSANAILAFYQVRMAKIFPLLWVALFLEALVTSQVFAFANFLGYKLTEHYWFISSLLECYLLSPFLYVALKYRNNIALGLMTVLFLLSNYAVGLNPALKTVLMNFHLTGFPYLELYLINICLFFLGMYFHRIWHVRQLSNLWNNAQAASSQSDSVQASQTNHLQLNLWNRIAVPDWATRAIQGAAENPSVAFILLLAISLTYIFLARFFLPSLPFLGGPILLSALSIYALSVQRSPTFWLSNAFIYAGRHSLAIYLLHMPYYYFLERINVIKMDSLTSFVVSTLLLPLFFATALIIEKFSNALSNRLISARL
ncbi:MAG: acyltransferase family protein [Cyanobacteria bacterium J06554_11]